MEEKTMIKYKKLKEKNNLIFATLEALPDGWEAEQTCYPIHTELSHWATMRISVKELKKICDRLIKEAKDD